MALPAPPPGVSLSPEMKFLADSIMGSVRGLIAQQTEDIMDRLSVELAATKSAVLKNSSKI